MSIEQHLRTAFAALSAALNGRSIVRDALRTIVAACALFNKDSIKSAVKTARSAVTARRA
jgi:hypothetical protein